MAPLDPDLVAGAVSLENRAWLGEIIVLQETGSTNDYAMQLPRKRLHGAVVVAEMQTAGKGRRGRHWRSPPGNLFMSFGWQFAVGEVAQGLLPLAAGLAVCRALERFGLSGHGIKWPNDVRIGREKLCGILVEGRSRSDGFDMVCGIGVNMTLQGEAGASIDQPWTTLAQHLAHGAPSRNVLAGSILDEFIALIGAAENFAGQVAKHWPRWDLLYGRKVNILGESHPDHGVARGIDSRGALCLETSQGLQAVHSAEVSVRES